MRRKLLASLLALCLVVGLLPTMALATEDGDEDEATNAWTECTSCSENSPHMIYTTADLDKIRTHTHTENRTTSITGYFKLANNIEFQGTDFEEGGTYYNGGLLFLPIGVSHTVNDQGKGFTTDKISFCGMLDGDGYAISNMKQNVHVNGYNNGYGNFRWWLGCGLIGSLNGTIKNLTVKNSNFCSHNGAGGMVCEDSTKNAVVKNLTLKDNLVSTWASWTYSGGIASYLEGSWEKVVVDGCRVNGYYDHDFIAYNITDATLTDWTFRNCTYQDNSTNFNPFLFSVIEGTNIIDNLTFENNNQIKLKKIRNAIIAHEVKGYLTIKNSTFDIVTQNFHVDTSWESSGGLFKNSAQASHITFQNTYFGLQVPDDTNEYDLKKIAGISDIDDLNSTSENSLFRFKKTNRDVIKEVYVDANGAHEALAADEYHWGANFTIGASGDAVVFENSNPNVICVDGSGQASALAFGTTTMRATATIDGQSYELFGGDKTISVTPENISDADARMYVDTFSYTGSEIKPNIRVELDGVILKEGTDYTVLCSNNVEAGTATATITGINHYTGTKSVEFYIVQGNIPEIQVRDKEVIYSGEPQTIDVTSSDGTIQYYVDGENVAGVSDAGIYYMTYRVIGSEDSIIASGGAYLTVKPATLTITADSKTIYVGDALPEYTYTVTGWQGTDGDTMTLEDVSVTCANANANKADNYPIAVTGPETIDNYTITYVNGTLTVRTRSGGGGGGGSSSSGSTTTENTENSDGSVTTTVTNKRTGTVTETTKYKDGSTLVVETKKDGTVTTTETRADGVRVKTVDAPEKAVTVSVTIPESVGTTAILGRTEVNYGTVAVDAESGEVVKLSVPTEGGLLVKLDGSAELTLVDKSKEFSDTDGHWAENAIDFATAHGMFGGTSETTFSPDDTMTRAMLMTVLARFDGADTAGGSLWYEKGMAWAVANGVSDGSDPEASISREQLAAMLWRYAGSPTVSGTALSEFSDHDSVSGYAADAMRWAVSEGLIVGVEHDVLAPQSTATRAQVATILMRFVEMLTK